MSNHVFNERSNPAANRRLNSRRLPVVSARRDTQPLHDGAVGNPPVADGGHSFAQRRFPIANLGPMSG